jgi:hypothetical protein
MLPDSVGTGIDQAQWQWQDVGPTTYNGILYEVYQGLVGPLSTVPSYDLLIQQGIAVGSGSNGTLNLSLVDVLNGASGLSSTTQFTIKSGGAVCTVDLTDGIGTGAGQWQDTGPTTVNGVVYDVYHNNSQGASTAADLLIQHGINVI